jgi:hypothetical protein
VYLVKNDREVHREKDHQKALEWIASKIHADMMGRVEYEIVQVYSNG